jgi:predicted membrane-bound dolichyl-phosphate-mannose-protein mannosyltransferase
MAMKQRLLRLYKWEYFWVCLFILVTLTMHFSVIYRPTELIIDEQHYVNDARGIIQGNDTQRPEHPPLGKLFVVAGVLIFGDNPLGWRFFSVILGTVNILLFYLICRRLALSRRTSSVATFLLALENLSFVQSSVAMLDVYSLTFTLAAFWLYLKDRYLLSGVAVALSALAKLYGVLALPAIVLHWLFTRRQPRDWRQIVMLVLVSPVAFLGLMVPLDFIVARHFVDPVSRIWTMLTLSGTLTFETAKHDADSRPWEWLLRPVLMAYWYEPHYTAGISFTIWALIIPTVLYITYRTIKKNDAGLFALAWFTSTYLFWIPTSLITNRISFIFYFYPTVGAICIGLGMGLMQIVESLEVKKSGKLRWLILTVPVYLLGHIAVFVILAPVFSR